MVSQKKNEISLRALANGISSKKNAHIQTSNEWVFLTLAITWSSFSVDCHEMAFFH